MTWRRLETLIVEAAGDDTTATYRSIHDLDATWGLERQLQAMSVDALNVLIWAKTEDAVKGRNRPEPIPRPGVKPTRQKSTTIGGKAIPLEQMRALLQRRRNG